MATALASSKTAGGHLKLTLLNCSRHYSTTSPPQTATPPSAPITVNGKHSRNYSEDGVTQRDFFFNVLNANATRRDAKQYLDRFKEPKKDKPAKPSTVIQDERNARHRRDQDRLDRLGVNLGGLYTPARAIADTPQFTQHEQTREQPATSPQQPLHVALVCLRGPEDIDDVTLDGLAVTLGQLVKLDMRIVLVVASNQPAEKAGVEARGRIDVKPIRKAFALQADRLCDAIDRHNPEGGRAVPNALELSGAQDLSVGMPNLILDPLKRGMIPIIPSLAYTASGQLVPVSSAKVMTAMTKHLSGLDTASGKHSASPDAETTALDRIIVLDNVGGIPSKERGDGAHVFINLQQEYEAISEELSEYSTALRKEEPNASDSTNPTVYDQHHANMTLVQSCLDLLPSASSALIVTPHEAAASSSRSRLPSLGAGTRRQKNPLIHNLLTNKPLVSSSLPPARNPEHTSHPSPYPCSNQPGAGRNSTVLRKGMPLTIIPSTHRSSIGWQRPPLPTGLTDLRLESDPRVDFARLIHLIENSFRRKLNVQHYLNRIEGRIAGLIIAGEYEGGAVLTWEMPPGTEDPGRLVPYLDKFAVLQSSQGSSGVADVVFQAMVRSCFPDGELILPSHPFFALSLRVERERIRPADVACVCVL